MKDKLSRKILKFINASDVPRSSSEIRQRTGASEMQVRWRMPDLLVTGKVNGKKVPGGQGIWIFWRRDAFGKEARKR